MKNIQLNSIWTKQRSKNCIIPIHCHDYYELVYYNGGNGITEIENNLYTFSDSTFTVIPPNKNHNELHHTDTKVICLEFSGVAPLNDEFFIDSKGTVYSILKEIQKEAANQPFGYEQLIKAKLTELYIKIRRTENSISAPNKSFEYIINYLSENYHEKIQLSDCAKQLNISYDYFQHKFKEITGTSPQGFLVNRRLEASKELLKNNVSCTETAYRCGFSTSAQFSMLFKGKYGISPKEYGK